MKPNTVVKASMSLALLVLGTTSCYADGISGMEAVVDILLTGWGIQLATLIMSVLYYFRRSDNKQSRTAFSILLIILSVISFCFSVFMYGWFLMSLGNISLLLFLPPVISLLCISDRLAKRSETNTGFVTFYFLRSLLLIVSAFFIVQSFTTGISPLFMMFYGRTLLLFCMVVFASYGYMRAVIDKQKTVPDLKYITIYTCLLALTCFILITYLPASYFLLREDGFFSWSGPMVSTPFGMQSLNTLTMVLLVPLSVVAGIVIHRIYTKRSISE